MQEASYTDLDDLAALLQHCDVVVCNAGTILLDALVGDRPAVCVLYDEGAPPGDSWAAKNVVGKHYEELAASGAFLRAESFDEVAAAIERSLASGGARGGAPAGRWTRSSARSTGARPSASSTRCAEVASTVARSARAEARAARRQPRAFFRAGREGERRRADDGPRLGERCVEERRIPVGLARRCGERLSTRTSRLEMRSST